MEVGNFESVVSKRFGLPTSKEITSTESVEAQTGVDRDDDELAVAEG